MKLSSALPRLALAASVLLLAGCPKKPERPTPEGTQLGSVTPSPSDNTSTSGPIFRRPVDSGPTPPTSNPGDIPQIRESVNPNLEAGRGVLASVLFAYDSAAIGTAEAAKLQAAAKYLADPLHADERLLLEGHCDWRGTAEYNLALGDRRAAAVKNYLVRLKVPAEKLETVSKGSIGAKEKGTDAEMAQDRKVEFVIVKAGAATTPRGGS